MYCIMLLLKFDVDTKFIYTLDFVKKRTFLIFHQFLEMHKHCKKLQIHEVAFDCSLLNSSMCTLHRSTVICSDERG